MTPQQKTEYNRSYRESNRDRLNAANALWREKNKARHRADARRWQIENPDRFRANQRRWKAENPDYSAGYYHSTEQRKITIRRRSALCQALSRIRGQTRRGDWRADSQIGRLVDCSKPALIAHFERLFQPGMSWENYGRGGWEIDHILPCNTFDLTDPRQEAACFHYTNLRPLWRPDNLSRPKGRA